MSTRYEMELTVKVSFDFLKDEAKVFEHYVESLYNDSHPNFWVNHVVQVGGVVAYDSETGDDI